MKNINEVFFNEILKEVGYAFQHGVNIKTPITHILLPKELNHNKLNLPESIIDFYKQTSKLTISWEIQDTEQNTKQFKEDSWLKEKYLTNNYDWGVVHEYLSGFVNITNAEDIFNSLFCKKQAYYYTLSNKKENQDSFFAFDICWSLTACLKKEGINVVDNVWLVDTDAEAVYDMGVTVEEYLNLADQAKGFHYWQLIYLFKQKSEYYELMNHFLPKILPHVKLNLEAFGIENK